MSRTTISIAIVLALALLAVACGSSASEPAPRASRPVYTLPRGKLAGFSTPGFPDDLSAFQHVEAATGVRANIASSYVSLGVPFDAAGAEAAWAGGALPVVEIDSDKTPLKDVVAGRWDGFLARYARAVAAYRSPVGIDFDHEFNGLWSTWGYPRNNAAQFVAAWRRMVTIFRRNGAGNVIWIWNPNVDAPKVVLPMRPWYPGDQYVTWVGLDGYFFNPGDTFGSIFGQTLRELSSFTTKRVLIVETGAPPAQRRPAQIKSLFAGLEATPRILGFIWFDYDKGPGDNWRLEDDPASVSAFRAGARSYLLRRR